MAVVAVVQVDTTVVHRLRHRLKQVLPTKLTMALAVVLLLDSVLVVVAVLVALEEMVLDVLQAQVVQRYHHSVYGHLLQRLV